MKNLALITGASSGIGKELAYLHAKAGGDLILVARRENVLIALQEEIKKEYHVSVQIVSGDLTQKSFVLSLYDFIVQNNYEVDVLINNAGFGGYGKFHERDWNLDESMINLNITSLALLSKLILPGMVERNSGKILNVASTAGFIPGPLQAVYYASKAFVRSLSMALSEEISDKNISVTILSPGPVKTEFEKVADLEGTGMFDKNAKSARYVAEKGYEGMLKGKLEVIPDLSLSLGMKLLIPFLPQKIVLKNVMKLQEKK